MTNKIENTSTSAQDCGCGSVSNTTSRQNNQSLNVSANLNPPPFSIVLPQPVSGFSAPPSAQIEPEKAVADIESRPPPVNLWRPNSQIHALGADAPIGPTSVTELASALRNDVDLIFEHIHDNYEFYPTFGLMKSPVDVIQCQAGNAFDLAKLMVELIRAGGGTASYQFGTLSMNSAQAASWLKAINYSGVYNLLISGGVPFSFTWTGTDYIFDVTHVWVKAQIGGNFYIFDPTLKTYTVSSGIDLQTATGYSQATFLSRSIAGATITSDYVKDINRTNIRSDLATFSTALAANISTNNPGAEVQDIVGGFAIVPLTGVLRDTQHPFLKVGTTPTEWTTDVNSAYKSTLRVQYPGIDTTMYASDISDQRLTFFFNGSLQPELKLGGSLVATGTAQSPGSWNSVLLTATHPTAFAYQVARYLRIDTNRQNVFFNTWGKTPISKVESGEDTLRKIAADGATALSEGLYGEYMNRTANLMASIWESHTDMVNEISDTKSLPFHILGQSNGPISLASPDVEAINIADAGKPTTSIDGNPANAEAAAKQVGQQGHMAERQANDAKKKKKEDGCSASGDKVIDDAAKNGDEIYDMNNGNAGTLIPLLQNYPTQAITDLQSDLSFGARAMVPKNGNYAHGIITAGGYEARYGSAGGTLGRIYATIAAKGGIDCDASGGGGGPGDKKQKKPKRKKEDPIDMATGAFLYNNTDITIGSGEYPYQLDFETNYTSNYRDNKGVLGRGWRHNFEMSLEIETDYAEQVASGKALSKVATIAATYVNHDIIKSDNTNPAPRWIASSLCTSWIADQVAGKAVTLKFPEEDFVFVRQPDGSYEEPPLCMMKLTKLVSGDFQAKTREGVTYNFNGTTGKLTSIVYPYGVTITLGYTAGNLTSISNGLTRILTLSYTGGYLSQVSDGTGRSVNYVVNGSGNLTQVTDPDNKTTVFVYDQPGRMTQVFKPANPSTAFVTNVYDSRNRVSAQTDALSNVSLVYNAGNRVELVDAAGFSQTAYFNRNHLPVKERDGLGNAVIHEYDGRGRQIRTTFPEGNKTEWLYNGLDLVSTVTYKAKPASGLADIVNTFTYDPIWNKVKTSVDGNLRTTTMNYDAANGNLLSIVYPTVGGQVPQVSWTYNSRGQVLTKTDETGIVTQLSYDATTEKLTSVVADFGSGRLNLTTNYGYNSRGDVTSVQNPRGFTKVFDYDVNRRLTQITEPAPLSYVTKFTYDANHNRTKVERQTGNVANPWQTYQFTFDAVDLLRTVTNPSNEVSTLDYNSRWLLWKVIDAENRTTENTYDAVGRLSTEKDNSGTISKTLTYTPNGRLASIKDARSNTTSFTWDGFDREDKTTYADTSFEQNALYDPEGNLLTFRTRSGNTTVMTYDELDRLKTKAPQGQPTVTFEYDLAGRQTKASKPVVSGDPSSGDFVFSFDTAGRLYREQYPDLKQVTFVLDANDNITRLTYPDGYYVERFYDEIDRLIDVKLNGSASAAAHFDYDPLSQRKKLTFNNGTFVDYNFELDSDLQSIISTWVGSSLNIGYTYDKTHRMKSRSVSDSQHQYDPPSLGTVTYSGANSVNQYPQIAGVSQTYNTNGCLTGDGTWTFGFDTEDHLLTASKSGTIASYLYDPLHRQAQKSVNTGATVKTNFVYSGWQRIADYDGIAGTLQNRWVYGDSLDEILIQVSSAGVLTYYYGDNHGSVIAQANPAGAVSNIYKYSPYGESPSMIGTTFGYTGQRYDSETGLYYFKNRHYSPSTGRFLQPDPIGFDDDLHLYTYVQSDPLNFSDPLGLQPVDFNNFSERYNKLSPADKRAVTQKIIEGLKQGRQDVKNVIPTKKGKPNNVNPGQNQAKKCKSSGGNPSKNASSTSGNNSAAQEGKKVHEKSQPPRELDSNDKNWKKNEALENGKRPDWRNDDKQIVVEDKPTSPRNLKRAEKQAQEYADQLQKETGKKYDIYGRLVGGTYKGKDK